MCVSHGPIFTGPFRAYERAFCGCQPLRLDVKVRPQPGVLPLIVATLTHVTLYLCARTENAVGHVRSGQECGHSPLRAVGFGGAVFGPPLYMELHQLHLGQVY